MTYSYAYTQGGYITWSSVKNEVPFSIVSLSGTPFFCNVCHQLSTASILAMILAGPHQASPNQMIPTSILSAMLSTTKSEAMGQYIQLVDLFTRVVLMSSPPLVPFITLFVQRRHLARCGDAAVS